MSRCRPTSCWASGRWRAGSPRGGRAAWHRSSAAIRSWRCCSSAGARRRAGTGQLVLLTGEAGIGKSRITEAMLEAVASEPHFLVRYQCSPYHAGSALHPAIQHLTHAAGIDPDDDPERRLGEARGVAGSGRRTNGDAGGARTARRRSWAWTTNRYGALTLTPQQRRARTLAALVDQMIGSAARRPVMWVVEDAHWIDPTTLEMLELALDRVQGSAVLVVVTARPTFAASFASHPVVTRLVLEPAGTRRAVQLIVERITGGKRLPGMLLDEIAARSDGVPLFVEEMTKAVLESGRCARPPAHTSWNGPLSGLAIPASLHDSLMARLDRLHPVKEVAQAAAVIGRSFDHATIAALSRAAGAGAGRGNAATGRGRAGVPARHAAGRDLPVQARLGARRGL